MEFLLSRMGADTEIADYGSFTPLLNTGEPQLNPQSSPIAALSGRKSCTQPNAFHLTDIANASLRRDVGFTARVHTERP